MSAFCIFGVDFTQKFVSNITKIYYKTYMIREGLIKTEESVTTFHLGVNTQIVYTLEYTPKGLPKLKIYFWP